MKIRERGRYHTIAINEENLQDLDICAKILKTVNKLLDKGYTFLALDFKEVSYINSTFIAILANIHNRVKRQNGLVVLYNLNANILDVLDVTNLTRVFTIVPNEDSLESV